MSSHITNNNSKPIQVQNISRTTNQNNQNHPQQAVNIRTEQQIKLLFQTITTTKNIEQLSAAIKEYCVLIVGSHNEQLFINYFTEYRFMQLLSKKLKQNKSSSQFLKSIFSLFEFLMKALKKEQQLTYFLVKINQEGFISSAYQFQEEEDLAYYVNFLKLMIRKINQQQRYLSVFFNSKQPHFPLLLKLLKFYDCPDSVMHTSSKLAIMQISNNPNVLVQKYIKNFPFIIFYPLYIDQIRQSLQLSMNEQNNIIHLQNLQNHLKFMQDFIQNKDRQAIDIYTNTFLKIIGQYIYRQMIIINEKTINRIKKLYKILIKYIIPQLSVVKIKSCLLMIFNTDISIKIKKCFSSKNIQLETNYWIFDKCIQEIIQHCKKVHYNDNSTINRSVFKIINSYIPNSKDNWLYYQMKKIQNLIGLNCSLGQEINHDSYLPESFLNALWTMVDDHFQINQIYSSILKQRDQQLLFYNIKVITLLFNCSSKENKLNMDSLVRQMSICTSLSLLKAFYSFTLENKTHFEESQYIQYIYNNLLQKLTHFILNKGIKQFLIRIKEISLNSQKQFIQDIYREIECEILLFAAIRTLLGLANDDGSIFEDKTWNNKQNVAQQTTFKGGRSNINSEQLSIILDGQYMKIKNRNEHLIHKQQLLLHNILFYEEGDYIVLIGNQDINNYSITIYIDPNLKSYLLREINRRKQLAYKIIMNLRDMKFQFTS